MESSTQPTPDSVSTHDNMLKACLPVCSLTVALAYKYHRLDDIVTEIPVDVKHIRFP